MKTWYDSLSIVTVVAFIHVYFLFFIDGNVWRILPDPIFVIIRTSFFLHKQLQQSLPFWWHQGPFFWSKSHSLIFFFCYPMNHSLTNFIWIGMSLFSTVRWCCKYKLFNHSLLQVLFAGSSFLIMRCLSLPLPLALSPSVLR